VPRIVVARRLPEGALALLHTAGEVWVSPHDRPLTTGELAEAAVGADALVTLLHDRVDADLLAVAGPDLAIVANVAVGYDNIDVAAAARRGVTITNTPGVLTDATADLAMALILMATRRLAEGERLIRADTTWRWDMFMMLGTGLQSKTLGIVGLGEIGTATARRARAFGMRIIYAQRRRAAPELEAELGASRVELDELLDCADVVSLHCPLTADTRHLVDSRRLARMRRGAFLVNTARGPIVDEVALVTALECGAIAGAALDVFEHEPEVHPGLIERDDVVLVPHLGSATQETRAEMGLLAARNVVAVLRGDPPLTSVTPTRRREPTLGVEVAARAGKG
jgi:glyoxylate reductase